MSTFHATGRTSGSPAAIMDLAREHHSLLDQNINRNSTCVHHHGNECFLATLPPPRSATPERRVTEGQVAKGVMMVSGRIY